MTRGPREGWVVVAALVLAGCGGDPAAQETSGGGGGGRPGSGAGAAGGASPASSGQGSGAGGASASPGAGGAGGGEPASCDPQRADLSSPPAGASWRYGGGVGYPDKVLPGGGCTTVVSTREELEASLAAAEPGHVVYVSDAAEIDLTKASLCIPAGVTLASGRGRDGSPGARLFTTTTESIATLKACGDDVRVTGLRLQGWEPSECPPEWPDKCQGEDKTGGKNCRDCMPRARGIQAKGVDRLEVDNCEITGFSYGAVELVNSRDNHVHHNHIHHNQRQGLGYGVVMSNVVDPADALIEWNRFDYNRHSVAGSGAVGHSYEARNNLVLPHANGHVFDMHGIDEATGDGTPFAGTRILVHDNTVLPANVYALVVRGRPTEGAWLYANCLARKSAEEAALQTRFSGNFWVDEGPSGPSPNAYGKSASQCEALRFCASLGGTGLTRNLAASTAPLSSLAFGDFDGDGKTDVFRADGSKWHWLPGGLGSWKQLNVSSAPLSSLAFGDFDGDGKTDVFRASGEQFSYSPGGSSPWKQLNVSSYALSSLAFGDFDGDGKTDVLRPDGTHWNVSFGGKASWKRLAVAGEKLGELGFGDFDGDGRTDVFRTGCL